MNTRTRTLTLLALAIAPAVTIAHAGAAASRPVVVRFQTSEPANTPKPQQNECADRIVARDLQVARASCDRAVLEARRWRVADSVSYTVPDLRGSRALAAALSNRALLELLSGNLAQAQAEIARARKLAPREAFVARNGLAIEQAIVAKASTASR